MNSKNLITVASAVVGGGAIAVAILMVDDRAPVEVKQAAPVAEAERTKADTSIVDNKVTVLENDLVPDRDPAFETVAEGFRAKGVTVDYAGRVKLEAYGTEGHIETEVVRAERTKGKETVGTLVRTTKPAAHAQAGKDTSRLRYNRYFEGIDLEYRWDGQEIEEFFYLEDELKRSLVSANEGLDIVSVIAGLFRQNGAFLRSTATSMVDESYMTKDVTPPMPEDGLDKLMIHGALELNHEGNRFALPAAFAFDNSNKHRTLPRTFEWTKSGLEVTTHVPAWYLRSAEGQVVIDPSVVTDGTALNLNTWNETNFIKDSTGRMYAGHMGVYNGRWVASYVRSVDDSGLTWEEPRIIEPSYGSAENTHYTPNLVIDSTDTLHAAWSDHGRITDYPAEKGTFYSWGHRMRYAYCDDFCDDNAWLPQGTIPKLVTVQANLAPTAAQHQAVSHMAVDSSDVVHLQWAEWGTVAARHRYFQIAGGNVIEKPGLIWNDIHSHIVVDHADNVHYLASDYWNNYSVRHYQWNRGTEVWDTKNEWVPRHEVVPDDPVTENVNEASDNGGRWHPRQLSAVADGTYIHLALNAYDRWSWYTVPDPAATTGFSAASAATYEILYGRYDIAADEWGTSTWPSGRGTDDYELLTTGNLFEHNYLPSMTMDAAGRVTIVWYKYTPPNNQILLTQLDAPYTPGTWSPHQRIANSIGSQYNPQTLPSLYWPAWHRTLQAGLVQTVYIENGDRILYQASGTPVEGGEPRTPLNHSYVGVVTPTFVWSRIGADTGGITYWLEIAPDTVFEPGDTTRINAGNANTYTLSGAPAERIDDGEYGYWRVQAENAAGLGPFGSVYEVGVDTSAPGTFSLATPAHNSDPGTQTPNLVWNPAAP